jgi:membrane-bound lytic murein transglycosylase D
VPPLASARADDFVRVTLKEIPDNGRKHYLVLPIDKLGLFMANEQLVYEQSKMQQPEPQLASKGEDKTVTPDQKTTSVVWENTWKSHKVKKGESLGGIADKYNVSLAELKKWNKIKGSNIVPGQSLKIQTKVKKNVYVEASEKEVTTAENKPAKEEAVSEAGEEENYQQSTDVPAKKQVEAKPAAQPEKTAAPAKYKYYTIQKGDTLTKIANAKGVTVNEIKHLNKGLKENKLAVGQKIKIKQI